MQECVRGKASRKEKYCNEKMTCMFVMSFRILASQAEATSGILMISGSVRLGAHRLGEKAWNNNEQLAGQAAAMTGTRGCDCSWIAGPS